MRSILLILCGGLVAVGVVLAARGTMPTGLATAPATSGDKAALGRSIRDYLMANPEVLVEAMQELERKQDSQRDTVAQKAIQENRSALMSDPESPIVGNPNGDVTIVEFSDYQCPYCKRAHSAVKSVLAADSKVKLVFKDLPILGEPSRIAAFAALAARAQNKHLALHDALMEFSGKLDRDRIMEIAASVGLDIAKLQKDMDDPKLKVLIERNMALASALGVRGTPAFVIGNQFVPGAVDADTLKRMISDARTKG
ncbi:DsbA family protein [Reyranella sp.]|jgi:protein-disulfide isomerase|uniref:DsbA family protein n=1 Tax=Reyranella sp. TaxID=1929291 RepID=UPI003D0D2B4F